MSAWDKVLAPASIGDLRRSLPLAPQRGGSVALDETVVAPLSDSTSYRVSGRDATKFLQGQLTCDVAAVDCSHSRAASWCSAKGRVRTTLRLLAADGDAGGYLLLLPADHGAALMEELQRFIFRAKVSIEALPDQLAFGICGDAALAWLKSRFGDAPAAVNDVIAADGVQLVRLPQVTTAAITNTPRFLITAARHAIVPLWQAASASFTTVASAAWHLLALLFGAISVNAELSDQYLPQMLNLDRDEGVSYTKGCYIGQEIVARTHHLGRLKRGAFTSLIASIRVPHHATTICATSGASVGSVITAAQLTPDTVLAQLLLRIDPLRGNDLRLLRPTGAAVTVIDPPPVGGDARPVHAED